MTQNNNTRRSILAGLGAGITTGLAGCNTLSESENSQDEAPSETENTPEQDQEQLDIQFGAVEDADLSDVRPALDGPESYELRFTADASKADTDLRVELTNGIQTQIHETTTDELEVGEDGGSLLSLPENLLVHGGTEITATFTGEDSDGTLTTEINTQTPSAFKIDRRVEGEQASNFQSEWAFAQHDLDREEARQAHLNYVNNEFVREPIVDESLYNGTHGLGSGYNDRISQIEQLNPNSQMLDILKIAAEITSNLEHDVPQTGPTGINQSGEETGYGAAQIIRDICGKDLKTIVTTTPDTGQDSIVQYNPESGDIMFQGTNGTVVPIETTFTSVDEDNENLYKSMIYEFEPGYVDGIDDDDASSKTLGTQASIMSMAEQANTANTNYIMNDYFLEEASDQIFEEGNVKSVSNIAFAMAEMALATNQATSFEARNPENNEDLPSVPDNGRIAVYMDENESLGDVTLAYVQDKDLGSNLYNRVVETADPAGRNEIEQIIA